MKFKFLQNKNAGDAPTLSKVSGYTLVETLVAVSIFSVSILGLLVTLSQGVADTSYAKRKIAAAYLAQEGIEYMRNLRDTYMIYDSDPTTGWTSFFNKLVLEEHCDQSDGCYIAADSGTLDYTIPSLQAMKEIGPISCSGLCDTLTYDPNTGAYGYSGSEDSGFRRTINAYRVTDNEIKIISTVSWTQPSGPYSVSFSEDLFSWIE